MKYVITLLLIASFFNIKAQNELTSSNNDVLFVCPPCNSNCDTLLFTAAGICPHCNMELVTEASIQNQSNEEVSESSNNEANSIAFYLQDGVEILDFAGPMEVFAYAGYEVFTVSKTKAAIQSQGILTFIPDYDISDAPHADIMAFFGGNSSNAFQDSEVIDWLKSRTHVQYYFSVCTGAFALAEAGLLNGKSATTFHNALGNLEINYPEVEVLKNARYVDNGKIITTAGISAGIDGALHMVAKLQGFNEARKVAYHMEYDKWEPGEGVHLSDDNPYSEFIDIDYLKDYEGSFEYLNGSQVQIQINEREKSLEAIIDQQKFPLFFLEKDEFLSLGKNYTSFERNSIGKVTGYRTAQMEGTFFKKLD